MTSKIKKRGILLSDQVFAIVAYITPIGLLISYLSSLMEYRSDEVKRHLKSALILDIIAVFGIIPILGTLFFGFSLAITITTIIQLCLDEFNAEEKPILFVILDFSRDARDTYSVLKGLFKKKSNKKDNVKEELNSKNTND